MIKKCPVCGERFDDSDGIIYCPKCGSIADDTVLLSERIEKQVAQKEQVRRPVQKTDEEAPQKAAPKYNDTDTHVQKLTDEGSNHTAIIVVVVLVVLAALAYYFFFMS